MIMIVILFQSLNFEENPLLAELRHLLSSREVVQEANWGIGVCTIQNNQQQIMQRRCCCNSIGWGKFSGADDSP